MGELVNPVEIDLARGGSLLVPDSGLFGPEGGVHPGRRRRRRLILLEVVEHLIQADRQQSANGIVG